jgi:hypothetical protein
MNFKVTEEVGFVFAGFFFSSLLVVGDGWFGVLAVHLSNIG